MSKIFDHFLNRSISHVVRFNGHPQQFPESLSEHSFYVAYFAMIIGELLKKHKEDIDEAKILKMALIHDMEETISGDILSPFKHYNEEILQAIGKVNQETIKIVFKDLPEEMNNKMIGLWVEESEQETVEAQIIKVADKLSLISKCYEEANMGNKAFEIIYNRELGKLKELDYLWWLKIKEEIFNSN